MMLSDQDQELLSKRGVTEDTIKAQLDNFRNGFPFLETIRAASVGDGIIRLTDEQQEFYLQQWEQYLRNGAAVMKFVPASGAASRMFKELFSFMESDDSFPVVASVKQFFDEIEKFAFYEELNRACLQNNNQSIQELKQTGDHRLIVRNLLMEEGLNYGFLPKGLLSFHKYFDDEVRTPVQEHLEEGALYAESRKKVHVHFTVSSEHKELFTGHLANAVPNCEDMYKIEYDVTLSEQKPSTDTIAVDLMNEPFRINDQLLFRPGGHGALIENLNDLDYDVVFVKNIDNVVPERVRSSTIEYKKLLAGVLVHLQKQIFSYLRELEVTSISDAKLGVIAKFCESKLNNHNPNLHRLKGESLRSYLFEKLNRPIRVCGMVINEGEPGGGPFFAVNSDGTYSLQVLESTQINTDIPEEKAKIEQATHFNPVDLVLGVKNYKGDKFNLTNFVDRNTGFISKKSQLGRELKALELPGLWNGAMSDWNTVFVEVPIETFNPVKTVNDLLRDEHQ